METKQMIRISVRNLVEFILRSGDIDNRHVMSGDQAMSEGSRIHRKLQSGRGSNYRAEVALKFQKDCKDYDLSIEGRADGIIIEEDVTIDEIKGIYMNLEALSEPIPVHLAQAKCYAYIYGIQNDLERIRVQMTYSNLDTNDMKYFTNCKTLEELRKEYKTLLLSPKLP